MAWRPISGNISGRLMPGEQEALEASGAAGKLYEHAVDAVAAFVGAMNAVGYPVVTDGSIPDQLRNYVFAMARQTLLEDFPELKRFQTEERKAASEKAYKVLELIALRKYGAIEPPPVTAGNIAPAVSGIWNSENRLIMRTHPIPSPSVQTQLPQTTPPYPVYAEANAAPDTLLSAGGVFITATHGVPITPVTMQATGGVGGSYTYSAAGLPTGLTISSAGVISGTPTATGLTYFTVTVVDGSGTYSYTVNCSITVS